MTEWRERLRGFFTHNLLLKLVSLIIAFLLWGFLMMEKKSEVSLSIPIRVENIPPQLVMTDPPPGELRVVVRGRRTQLTTINERVMPYTVDLSGVKAGTSAFEVIPAKINIPRGLQIVHVSPSQFTIELSPVVTRTLPVNVRFQDELPKGYKLRRYTVQPKELEISGAKQELVRMRTVDTEPIDLSTIRGDLQLDVDLALSGLHLVDVTTHVVEVFINVEEVVIEKIFKDIPLTLPQGWRSRREAVDVVVKGPTSVVQTLRKEDILATVTPRTRKRHQVDVEVQLPERVSAEKVSPGRVEIRP